MINPKIPATTVKKFIALAKCKPGQMRYSSSGAGGCPAIADLLAGHVELSTMTVLEASGHNKSGKLKALAVTSAQRVRASPDVHTLAKAAIPGFDSISWIGLGGVPRATTPAQFAEMIDSDRKRYADIIKDRGITTE